MQTQIIVTDESYTHHCLAICEMIEAAALIRGTGIAKRDPDYIRQKITDGNAVIALNEGKAIGFCYIESWEDKKFVVNSGLIVHPDFRETGLAKAIKRKTFLLSKEKYPHAKLFGITTSKAVMKINSGLGYSPVTFSELTQDESFWKGCQGCINYDILQRTNKTMCLCTGMLCDLSTPNKSTPEQEKQSSWENFLTFMSQRKTRIKKLINQFPQLTKLFQNGSK